MIPKIILDAAHDGQLTDIHDIVLVDSLVQHWGETHVTDGTPCFCGARIDGDLVIHRSMPWERQKTPRGSA